MLNSVNMWLEFFCPLYQEWGGEKCDLSGCIYCGKQVNTLKWYFKSILLCIFPLLYPVVCLIVWNFSEALRYVTHTLHTIHMLHLAEVS